MMNKNLSAFLFHTLQEQGLPKDFINSLLRNSCEAIMLANMSRCTWDSVNPVLTTEAELAKAEKTKAFEGAAWFWDEFGLLGKNARNQKKFTAPDAIFNLDGAGS